VQGCQTLLLAQLLLLLVQLQGWRATGWGPTAQALPVALLRLPLLLPRQAGLQ
jgi:hypothetical protein